METINDKLTTAKLSVQAGTITTEAEIDSAINEVVITY